jgi:sugar phosphate isomerase/epimerase
VGLTPLPEIRSLYDRPAAWDGVVVPAFERIARAAAKLGAPVVVAVFPLFTEPPAVDYAAIYAKVADEARRHGLVGVDLSQAAYRDVPVAKLLKPSKDPIHPNSLAHRKAAEAIVDALVTAAPGILVE